MNRRPRYSRYIAVDMCTFCTFQRYCRFVQILFLCVPIDDTNSHSVHYGVYRSAGTYTSSINGLPKKKFISSFRNAASCFVYHVAHRRWPRRLPRLHPGPTPVRLTSEISASSRISLSSPMQEKRCSSKQRRCSHADQAGIVLLPRS